MKKLEIEKTKPTFIISVLKVDIIKVGLVFSISNFFITKTPLANNWRRKKIPSCSYLALAKKKLFVTCGQKTGRMQCVKVQLLSCALMTEGPILYLFFASQLLCFSTELFKSKKLRNVLGCIQDAS